MKDQYRSIGLFMLFIVIGAVGSCRKENQGPPVEWEKTFGGAEEDWFTSVSATSDGGYIVSGYTGSFGAGASDLYLIKTNGNGDVQWSKTYGGDKNDQAKSIIQTKDGCYTILGHTFSFGAGGSDIYLLKINTNGDSLWTKTYGGVGDPTPKNWTVYKLSRRVYNGNPMVAKGGSIWPAEDTPRNR